MRWGLSGTRLPKLGKKAEMALAHTIEKKVEAAYRRGDLFEKRRLMMQSWSNYLQQQENIEVLAFNNS
jgi:hypothetical protein